jgi:hypothetical protein
MTAITAIDQNLVKPGTNISTLLLHRNGANFQLGMTGCSSLAGQSGKSKQFRAQAPRFLAHEGIRHDNRQLPVNYRYVFGA